MKLRTEYVCQNCGVRSPRWQGRCESCGAWNSFVEDVVAKNEEKTRAVAFSDAKPLLLDEIESTGVQRLSTGIAEFDRVLGGGIVPGSVILLGGDPGIGKSTLMLQLCRERTPKEARPAILYVSGEESGAQLKMRAARLGVSGEAFYVLTETNIDSVLAACDAVSPSVVIVDSIQTMYREGLESTPGSVSQLRDTTAALIAYAKKKSVSVIIIGHVTKEGMIAGPRILEHMVDTVLQFEGDNRHAYRILRGVKNRFGGTNEVGIFEMAEKGLIEVENPSEVLLSHRPPDISGSCVCASVEGTRAYLVEVQALVAPSNYGVPQRTVSGIDNKRHALLLAILEKRCGMRLGVFDIFTNIVGGLRIDETAVDLAVALAIVSSERDVPIDPGTAAFGELGLGGELRPVGNVEKRLMECEKLGFKRVIMPRLQSKPLRSSSLVLLEANSLFDALELAFP